MSTRTTTDPGFALRFFDAGNRLPAMRALKPLMLEQMRLHRGQRVLEVGCGTGDDVCTIARRVGATGHVLGIDASPLVIAEATRRSQSRNLPVEFRVGDALALDLPAESVDRCRAERLLMHAHAEPATIVGELTRVLRANGRLVVFDLDWDTLAIDGAEQELTRRIVRSYSDGVANGCVGRTLPRLLRDAGLVEVTTIPHAIEIPFDFFGWVLSGHLDSALAAGLFTPAELIGWWDAIDAANARGRFFAAILGFAVAGSKPA
ncbi:MAG TPA: methyltransferase domain-containing protein [Conexibacter sp.]|jgi:ubiquinone/menaquinone biosynthesis C-methylase UbiE|nr:methyltransferase domain-containing protein [Conexibacter sp.]